LKISIHTSDSLWKLESRLRTCPLTGFACTPPVETGRAYFADFLEKREHEAVKTTSSLLSFFWISDASLSVQWKLIHLSVLGAEKLEWCRSQTEEI
jgi:hypothetical protein